MSDASSGAPPAGRLMQLLSARGGTAPGSSTMVLQHREALICTLGKAAAPEQLVMFQYLYVELAHRRLDVAIGSSPWWNGQYAAQMS